MCINIKNIGIFPERLIAILALMEPPRSPADSHT